MKTISIKQPWAHLICTPRQDNPQLGIKDIENRTWPTKFRGRVLVHASGSKGKKFKINLTDDQMKASFGNITSQAVNGSFAFGAIIGSVEIVDCVVNHPSIWAEKTVDLESDKKFILYYPIYNWVLANPVLFAKPITNVKGKLSFWEYQLTEESYQNLVNVDTREAFESLPKIEL